MTSKLRLPESYSNLPVEDYNRKTIVELSEVLKPLYYAILESDKTLEILSKPLDFVETQMLKITEFLTFNGDYYLRLTKTNDCREYIERIRVAAKTAHCAVQISFALGDTNELDMALTMAAAFFDELDKLFITKTRYIVFYTNELINDINSCKNR